MEYSNYIPNAIIKTIDKVEYGNYNFLTDMGL